MVTSLRPSSIQDWIIRWVDLGLIDEPTATSLRHDVDTTVDSRIEVVGEESTLDRVLDAAKGLVVEAFGYLGAALTLGAIIVLADIPDWSHAAIATLTGIAAVVGGVGMWMLTPPDSPATRRLAGVLAAVSVAMIASTIALVLDPFCDYDTTCSRFKEDILPLFVSIPTLVASVVYYARHRHLLTHVAFGGATIATLVTLSIAMAGESGNDEVVFGAMLFVASLAWVYASETELLVPAWLGTFTAGATTFMGLGMFSDINLFDPDFETFIVGSLLVGAGYAAVGFLQDRIRLTVVGVTALLFAVPGTLTQVFGLSGEATSVILLPVGIALTSWAILAARSNNTDHPKQA